MLNYNRVPHKWSVLLWFLSHRIKMLFYKKKNLLYLGILYNANWWKYKTTLKIRTWKPLVHTICRLKTLVDFRNVGFRLCSECTAIGFIVGLFLICVKNTPYVNPLIVYCVNNSHGIEFIPKLYLFALPHSRNTEIWKIGSTDDS